MAGLTIEERVAAGVKYLDEHRPGWLDRIFLDSLDLSDPCLCVLGQVYGNYWESPLHGSDGYPDERQNRIAAFGFNARWQPGGWRAELPECALLDAEWKRVITARREAIR